MTVEWQLRERGSEIITLAHGLDRARTGTGTFCRIQGTAGVGKSRLLAELKTMAELEGFRVLSARGSDLEQSFAFGVVRQLFESVVTSDDTGLLTGAAGQAAHLMGPVARWADHPTGDLATLHGLFWLTVNACEQRPLLLIVDDVHHADPPSLRFLAYLLPRLNGLALMVAVALRPDQLGAGTPVLTQIVHDAAGLGLRPGVLSAQAVAELVSAAVTGTPEHEFLAACHRATGGNPLFLRKLVDVVTAEGIEPIAANAERVVNLGPRALAHHIELALGQLPAAAGALVRAVAVLGDGGSLHRALRLADQPAGDAADALRVLERAEVLVRDEDTIGFVHPLVRTAVYDGMDARDLLRAHRRAAELLAAEGEPAERIGAHLLPLPPEGNPTFAAVLRRAAEEALAAGSAEIAYLYLRRCLAEPPADPDRLDVLVQLGVTAFSVDVEAAADHLVRAFALAEDPARRGQIAYLGGLALCAAGRTDQAASVLITAIDELGETDVELTRALEAVLLTVPLQDPDRQDLNGFLLALAQLPPDASAGGRMLDCVIAHHRAQSSDRADAVARARRALSGPGPARWSHAELVVSPAWSVLLAADTDEAMEIMDAAVANAHRCGSQQASAFAHTYRALGWLWRGSLAEAERDARDAQHAVDTVGIEALRPITARCLAEIHLAQGSPAAAERALAWARVPEPIPRLGGAYQFLMGRARLHRVRGDFERALADALEVGRRAAAVGLDNPALMAWRSEAALCLRALGRAPEARSYAAVEVVLARRWGAARALGHALRVTGLVDSRPGNGITLLREAVDVLAPSSARLAYAEALVDLGAAQRRSGSRLEAKSRLKEGAELAEMCGAGPLLDRAAEELKLTGSRRSTQAFSGPGSLTPGERRVADLAVLGQSNRAIAQALFVTPKTVELHLSHIYRKLGIQGRRELAAALAAK